MFSDTVTDHNLSMRVPFFWLPMESSRETAETAAAQGSWMAGMKIASDAWLNHGDGHS